MLALMSAVPGSSQRVFISGATGFVGRHLKPALDALGYQVRCGTRRPELAARRYPEAEWVRFDLEDPSTLEEALGGCGAAFYLAHGLGSGEDYPERERRAALAFREASERARLGRVIYLGGVAPQGAASRHLQSRLDTGRLLREGGVPTLELRAAMVIGRSSASWQMVRDLAMRLPLMILPRWLDHLSYPIAVDDVVYALARALEPSVPAGCYDLPGPECVSHRQLLQRVSRLVGTHIPMLRVPVVTPKLSAYWIALVTDVSLAMARELVQGLGSDLLPTCRPFWEVTAPHALRTLDQAVYDALADETSSLLPSPSTRARLRGIAAQLAQSPPLRVTHGEQPRA